MCQESPGPCVVDIGGLLEEINMIVALIRKVVGLMVLRASVVPVG